MIYTKYLVGAILVMLPLAASACPAGEVADPAASLQVEPKSLSVSTQEGQRIVTSLGSLSNTSAGCIDDIVVEVRYFDRDGRMVDAITENLYGVTVSPSREAVFRIQGGAAKPADQYVRQAMRVVSARAEAAARDGMRSTTVRLLFSWGPLLLIVVLWFIVIRRAQGPKSWQARLVAHAEQQNEILERLVTALERQRPDESR